MKYKENVLKGEESSKFLKLLLEDFREKAEANVNGVFCTHLVLKCKKYLKFNNIYFRMTYNTALDPTTAKEYTLNDFDIYLYGFIEEGEEGSFNRSSTVKKINHLGPWSKSLIKYYNTKYCFFENAKYDDVVKGFSKIPFDDFYIEDDSLPFW